MLNYYFVFHRISGVMYVCVCVCIYIYIYIYIYTHTCIHYPKNPPFEADSRLIDALLLYYFNVCLGASENGLSSRVRESVIKETLLTLCCFTDDIKP